MLTRDELETLARHFLDAWNSQDVEAVLACYTDDLVYRDPNTRGSVIGSGNMRRYLMRLFTAWKPMAWISSRSGAASPTETRSISTACFSVRCS